ncbi:subtilisin family serine protease/outer membrane protein assembly factor BamB/5-hydroxyisourate hydrolase-like protein (transthyretin family) [Alkalibacillus filiformis]|uniref:Subtilisin family serine protease/outer membrane protein assembly factor BamB/5-hydroxyisourate hydrolase-like protein (Transthyretin family) n=1 Tax=Alkalibacillus filiformis TaxID=200990 RepID=A0ABU0DVH4_9BACI|nr:carboxypeptidase regulatory-like domain-containing protein [Alkalibacillus filiformis]MDQ0352286.1 subtilisin family serine protease/outer membrane protein assembly factor BamB/5-hydroxyisourate hydrolase-like protein (transthyretin family) [Alkalibacillus filiformis]
MKKLNRHKWLHLLLIIVITSSSFLSNGAFTMSAQADEIAQNDETVEQERELAYQEEQQSPNSIEEEDLSSILDGLGFEPNLQDPSSQERPNAPPKVDPNIKTQLEQNEKVDVIIRLTEQENMNTLYEEISNQPREQRIESIKQNLQAKAETSQESFIREINHSTADEQVEIQKQLWINNSIVATVDKDALDTIEQHDDVNQITLDKVIELPEITIESTEPRLPEWGLEKISAPDVWGDYGIKGEEVVVGIMDTGVEVEHEALKHNYRGRDGNHEYSWIDVSGHGYDNPTDGHGHGTHVAGTAVGGGDGEPIGVAPKADWIAAKIFDDSGATTTSAIHEAFEWFLAPGGDPSKAPHVVNNSWGNNNTYNTEFYEGVQAWVAAGIFPLFSAGNSGPGAETIGSPASFPESYAVGATNIHDQVASFSSRGPVFWENNDGETVRYTKPEISAPGHEIYSAWPGGEYNTISGTSMASPHVAGSIALLLSSNPDLTIDNIKDHLERTARIEPHMSETPNDLYGYGIINIHQAVTEVAFSGQLIGQVLNKEGEPVPATIKLPEQDLTYTLEDDGHIDLTIQEGNHEVIVDGFGYETLETNITIEKDDTTEVNWTLSSSERDNLTGEVLNEDGEPVSYAFVRLKDTPLQTERTDQNGHFSFEHLPIDTYELQVSGQTFDGVTKAINLAEEQHLTIEVHEQLQMSHEDWRTANHNYERNAVSPNVIDENNLDLDWTYDTDSRGQILFSTPSATNDTIVLTTDRGWIVALDAKTGEESWAVRFGSTNRSTPTIEGNIVYVSGGDDQSIYALDLETGSTIWSRFIGQAAIYASPIVEGDTIYVSSGLNDDATLYALDKNSGDTLWANDLGGSSFFGSALGDDYLYVGTYDNRTLRAFDPDTGEEVWTFTTEQNEGFASRPVYEDQTLYVTSANLDHGSATLYAIDAQSGEVLWQQQGLGDPQAGSPIVYEDLLIISSLAQPILRAFDKNTGEELWSNQSYGTSYHNGAVSSNGVLFLTNSNGSFFAIDVYTGEVMDEYNMPNYSTSGTLILPGTVIVPNVTSVQSYSSPGILTGTITDEDGQPLEGTVSVKDTDQSVEANEDGTFTLMHQPGEYEVKVEYYGKEQVYEHVDFVSGYEVEKAYTLTDAPVGSFEITVIDERTNNSLEDVTVNLTNTPINGSTNSDGEFHEEEVYTGSYDLNLQLNGYVEITEEIEISAGTDNSFEFDLQPYDIAVLNDFESEITNFLNTNGFAAEERDWDVTEDLDRYDILYLNGAYTSGGWQPDEETFNELVEQAEANNVHIVFADTWGPSYGSIRHLVDYYNDPEEISHTYNSGTVSMQVDESHPIFDGYDVGDTLTLYEQGGDFAWFNEYSGREISSIGSSQLGMVGTGVGYKAITEDSAHLLLASHAASPWVSPYQGWLPDMQNTFLNSIEYLQNVEFGEVNGTIEDQSGNPISATVMVDETNQTFETDGELQFYHDEGNYSLTIRSAGFETETLDVEVEHGAPFSFSAELQSTDGGSVSGTVINEYTSNALENVAVEAVNDDEVIAETETDETGYYELLNLDEGDYELTFSLEGYLTETTGIEVESSPITIDQTLRETPDIAVLADYFSSSRNFQHVFSEYGIEVEQLTYNNVHERVGDFDVIFINAMSSFSFGEEDIDELFKLADEEKTSLIIGETDSSTSPLPAIVEHRNDPEYSDTVSDTSNPSGYFVTEDHDLFRNYEQGEFIELLVPSNSNIGYFENYSGYTIAESQHQGSNRYGPAVAYKPRTDLSVELLMAGHGFSFRHHADHYTDEAKQLLIDSVIWAAHAEFSTIDGTVTDEDGQPLLATTHVVGEEIEEMTDPNSGEFSIPILDGDYELEVSSFGYETKTVSASAGQDGEPLNITMQVSEDAGTITGHIESEVDASAISDVSVNLEGFPRSTISNTQGAYTLENIEPGTYSLTFESEDHVLKEIEVEVQPGETTTQNIELKPSPTVGIIVDNTSSSGVTLSEYLEERGYNTTDLLYTDLDQLSEVDLIFANSDYGHEFNPTQEEFDRFVERIDEEQLPIIWTGHTGDRGAIRFLNEFENNPGTEITGQDSNVAGIATEAHPIVEGVELENPFPMEASFDRYYAFDDYDGESIAQVEIEGERIGDLVAYKGRTSESVEILLGNMTISHLFHPGGDFDENRETIINNAILWALDNEEPLAGDLHGTLENDLDQTIQGTITVAETGKTVTTDQQGEFFLGLPAGDYTLLVEAYGHETTEFQVTIDNGSVYDEVFTLESNDVGVISGTVYDSQTEESIPGATISLLGTPIEVEADENGYYEAVAPVGEYDVRANAPGYMGQTTSNVEVVKGEEVTTNFYMSESEEIAVITTTTNQSRFDVLFDEIGYEVDYFSSANTEELLEVIDEYALIIFNNRSSSISNEEFQELIDEADEREISMIFASQFGGGTIADLRDIYNNPESVNWSFVPGHVNLTVETGHPLFAGISEEEFSILESGSSNQQYAVYNNYSGTTVGQISHNEEGSLGEGIGYDFRTANSVHLLLSGLQVGTYADVESNWTDEAKLLYANSIDWAISASLGEVTGTVTDEDGNPIEQATVSIPDNDLEVVTNANGEYRIGVGSGTYEVTAQATGFHEKTQSVTIEEQGDTVELNFSLEEIEGTSISGVIIDDETNEPIEEATVTLTKDDEELEITQSNADGEYTFDQLLPGEYSVSVEKDGFIGSEKEVTVETEPISIDLMLNNIIVAVIDDHNHELESLLNEHDLFSESVSWDVLDRIEQFELVVVNSNQADDEQVEQLIERTDELEISVMFLGTWGQNDGSIHLLEQYAGYPTHDQHGYDEGEVILKLGEVDHPIFNDLPDSFVIHGEGSPYSTFRDYPGSNLANLIVNDEDLGTAIAYEYRSEQSIHLLLSSFAATNMIAPTYGWTEDAKTLFVQSAQYAMEAETEFEEPSKPAFDEEQIRTNERGVEITGTSDPNVTINIYEKKDDHESLVKTVTSDDEGIFETTIDFDHNGNTFLYAEAENEVGQSEMSDRLQVIIIGNPNRNQPNQTDVESEEIKEDYDDEAEEQDENATESQDKDEL